MWGLLIENHFFIIIIFFLVDPRNYTFKCQCDLFLDTIFLMLLEQQFPGHHQAEYRNHGAVLENRIYLSQKTVCGVSSENHKKKKVVPRNFGT